MNIDSAINKLLFDHDCVIVPGLGGFVASPRASMHNKIHHKFIPPARVIAFNVFLKQNDGLLANHISSVEKIPFSEALGFLEKYVERCFLEMAAGRRFTIAEVGQLYYDAEKNIQFEPDDSTLHSFDSFGLTPIRAIPVNNNEREENVLLSPLRQSVSPKEKRKTQRKISGRKMMNAMLIAGITLWASFNLYIISPKQFNLGNLNPFERSSPRAYSPRSAVTLTPENMSPPVSTIQPYKNEIFNPAAAPEENSVEASGNYFVVAGVFKIPSNAEKFLAKLKADGYENSGAIERENKPAMIFVSRHRQKEDALQSRQTLKEKGIDAWVYAGKN